MLKGLRVPTHRVDAPGVYIFPHDGAWNVERIAAERAELVELATAAAKREAVEKFARSAGKAPAELSPDELERAEGSVVLTVGEREAALERHPFERYLRGETRFDLAALDQGPRGQQQITDYLSDGAAPTEFHLRRVGWRDRAAIEVIRDPVTRWAAWVRAGVARIVVGGAELWAAKEPGDVLPETWIESLCDADGGAAINLINLAGACAKYSAPPNESEGKRCA